MATNTKPAVKRGLHIAGNFLMLQHKKKDYFKASFKALPALNLGTVTAAIWIF